MSHISKSLIDNYKADKETVYNTWFRNNEERLKAFRSIKRGVRQVIKDIRENEFGNDYKGSSLEVVMTCIAEQKQVFTGAAHPFYWKPKLRIPDIYENETNKTAFGQFLENCLKATKEEQIIREIILLDQLKIKGLGPAVASILYFLHPTIMPPFNTAILNGYNLLFKENRKLGSWDEYLKMRAVLLENNQSMITCLSNDLGAIAGLLFDIGARKIIVSGEAISEKERLRIENLIQKRHKEVLKEQEQANLHTEMQYHLLKIGHSLGYDVISASNDRSKCHNRNNFSSISLAAFPDMDIDRDTFKTIKLIDVVWFEKGTNKIVCAFEVEKSTSIYSGILRLEDLSFSLSKNPPTLFLAAPNNREKEILLQLNRPAIRNNNIRVYYILFSELGQHCDAICKFGEDKDVLKKIAKTAD